MWLIMREMRIVIRPGWIMLAKFRIIGSKKN